MKQEILKGDIFLSNLNPVKGDEQGGVRPVLVIQNDIGNYYSNTTIVAAITSKHRSNLPTHVKLFDKHGLLKNSVVLTEQIRTIDKSRLIERLSHLCYTEQLKVDHALIKSLCIKRKAFVDESS